MANSTAAATHKPQPKYLFDFIGNRKIAFVVSIVTIVLGIGSILFRGNLGSSIDFSGGTLVELRFSEVPAIEEIRSAVTAAGFQEAVIQKTGDGHNVLIRVPTMETADTETGQNYSEKLLQALHNGLPNSTFEVRQTTQVGPQVGSELQQSAQLALLFAIAGMVLYISWRFEGVLALPIVFISLACIGLSSWQWLLSSEYGIPALSLLALVLVLVACIVFKYHFALAAIVALIHDVFVTVGALSLTNREINLTIIAALLTIIGYSVNDTIVIFDRIRENLRLMSHHDPYETLNKSIIQTLSRTLLTGLATIAVLLIFYFIGGPVLNGFAFTLLVGIITGTYSSVFVATPILYVWNQRVKGGIFKRA